MKRSMRLNNHFLPPGVEDRAIPRSAADLVHFTTHTVMHNLTEGILLVSIILFLVLLATYVSAIIVVLTISVRPCCLLRFAST